MKHEIVYTTTKPLNFFTNSLQMIRY